MHSSLPTLLLLSTPIHANTIARVWTHFYPSCPGEPFSNLDTYENYEETVPAEEITVGSCANIGVPSYEHNLVSAISVDAELISHEKGHPYPPEGGPNCNITVHEVPECVDPPLITKALQNGVEVSGCEPRQFAAYSEVWVQLVCESKGFESLQVSGDDAPRLDKTASTHNVNNIQTPGSDSNSWSMAQEQHSERRPEDESRVNEAGHSQSDQVVHDIMMLIQEKQSHVADDKHNATKHQIHTPHAKLNQKNANATAPANRTVMSRRKLSVLRNRARLY
ncbi:hypothetical protein N7532_011429 [Penicillium argentinense]|uniref:Uncharacterized protein n=1 Tax=Penicillium argentinense TaxID=1131581 RepID=A0A9W9EID1_9EURO|nr:uncharacterized protein N7532_011429 [Penicillium argentinense]KAJ5082386.1 hypothetical protein N7532_011429 [Penicillium argentinense]